MKTAGIICEYNPLHLGHAGHIEKTRQALDGDCAVICVMSGNFVQRGDFAIFNKYARAKAALQCGADLVVELPLPYALSSAEGFANAGVYILDRLGVCDYISFGSESGDIGTLSEAAEAIASKKADILTKEWLDKGLSYAAAQQRAADAVLGARSEVFKYPNNLLGIEYLKAIKAYESPMKPMTVKRSSDEHDGETGLSSFVLRKALMRGDKPWGVMPDAAVMVYMEEIAAGRGPVFINQCELAILSRLRSAKNMSELPGAAEGLEHRLMRYAETEPTFEGILEKVKTKRYTMSRLRRMLLCSCLGITAADTQKPPPYIKVMAVNHTGMKVLANARKKTRLPIITKPASVKSLSGRASDLFNKEAAATDFYVLSYKGENNRYGGQEWRQTPWRE
ncbi:MAG: nucleotidyltransferase family protein [Oscillospiraceae bacterium]|nr:nucleotidyltransferase family protein [Oscillospiraceae bacterium]